MNFLDAISKLRESKGMVRLSWDSNHPVKYLWLTSQSVIVMSIGGGLSSPPFIPLDDYLAVDWEIITISEV
jgi:hypothetical protein